jgi:hypothetical protein
MVVGGDNVAQPCRGGNRDYTSSMSKIVVLLVLVAALVMASGCKSHSGSREYTPGKGWTHTD